MSTWENGKIAFTKEEFETIQKELVESTEKLLMDFFRRGQVCVLEWYATSLEQNYFVSGDHSHVESSKMTIRSIVSDLRKLAIEIHKQNRFIGWPEELNDQVIEEAAHAY